jgi:S-adenosylmethionine:tRNA ribosyltransferase-isomerase
MIAAHRPVQRPADARLLVLDRHGRLAHYPRSAFVDLLRPGDLVVANDAATLPASLQGVHVPTGAAIEVRLAGRRTLATDDVRVWTAVVFGAGDFRTRTEDRPLPPPLRPGDRLALGPLDASVEALLDHPRLIALKLRGTPCAIWAGLASHGRPIQYAHVPTPLALWDVWTPIAGRPAAFEPPSAGFALDWASLARMRARGVTFATITLAAGISSTGDPALDRRLPFDEPFRVASTTAAAVGDTKREGCRVVAVGTTVVRALEHAVGRDGLVHAGFGIATGRVGPSTPLRVVDSILSGTHEPDSSHFDLLRAFADDAVLARAQRELERGGYRTHEFGDSMLIESSRRESASGESPRDLDGPVVRFAAPQEDRQLASPAGRHSGTASAASLLAHRRANPRHPVPVCGRLSSVRACSSTRIRSG